MKRSGVDHTVYDTTSILATIEHGLHLAPLAPGTPGSPTCATHWSWAATTNDHPTTLSRSTTRRGAAGWRRGTDASVSRGCRQLRE